MRIHVLTAVTRPENLTAVGLSLRDAIVRADADVVWHLRFDPGHEHVGGQGVKNALLDEVSDGWVWFLDDDTLVHPDLFTHLDQIHDAVVFSMRYGDGVLDAAPKNAKHGAIDIGQVILSRSLVGKERIQELYDGDGHFLEYLLRREDVNVLYVPEILTYYNAFTGGKDVYGLQR